MLKISVDGINLIKQFEGLLLEAYKDVAGVWTIGYGHTQGVKAGGKITKQYAEILLLEDIKHFENEVNRYDAIYHWTQNEFDALVSFAFNIGNINQLTQNGKRTRAEIAEKITAYCNATINGTLTKVPGLVKRREEEKKLFLSKSIDINAGNFYTIKKGDTLTKIAKNHSTTVKKLVTLNNIKNPDLIYAGDTIRVR